MGRKIREMRRWTAALRAVILSLLLLFGALGLVQADVFNVPAGDVNALIDAINASNNTSGADAIYLEAGTYTLVVAASFDTGLPFIEGEVEINGASLNTSGDITTTIERSADAMTSFRIFRVTSTGNLTLRRLNIKGGGSGMSGAGIANQGRLRIEHSAVIENNGHLGGGIINSGGDLTLFHTTVRDNHGRHGGGLYATGGTTTIRRSTFHNNSAAGDGGAVMMQGNMTSMSMANSTISGNHADHDGGGIRPSGELSLAYVTITNNTADAHGDGNGSSGGLILRSIGITVKIKNSIIAGNSGAPSSSPPCSATSSQGYNLVGNDIQDLGCQFAPATTDLVGTPTAPIDPGLLPLADNNDGNGGPQTHALSEDSLALDVIPETDCFVDFLDSLLLNTVDERNRIRPANGLCDIGAYEHNAMPVCGWEWIVVDYVGLMPRRIPLYLPATIVGTQADDVLQGTDGPDRIHGLGGHDTIQGMRGDDFLCGGPGNDDMDAGRGNDLLLGDDGNDTMRGGDDDDFVLGSYGDDTLEGKTGDDSLMGGPGDDEMNGGGGTDWCYGDDHVMGDSAASNCENVVDVP